MFLRSPHKSRYIINVSAMEGKFYKHKTPFHPHTNAAKAALNMMTRTSGQGYAIDGIFMSSVDTGWITDENPLQPMDYLPLDEIDGSSRILDPICVGIQTGKNECGVFWKDYVFSEW